MDIRFFSKIESTKNKLNLVNVYLLKVSNRNTRKRCIVSSKLTITGYSLITYLQIYKKFFLRDSL